MPDDYKPGDIVLVRAKIRKRIEDEDGKISYAAIPVSSESWSTFSVTTEDIQKIN